MRFPNSSPPTFRAARAPRTAYVLGVLSALSLLSACRKSTPPEAQSAAVEPSGGATPAAGPTPPAAPRELSEEDAHRALPRADLSGLSGPQRAVFLDVASDVFDYAGCADTLAHCLASNVQDCHALRMANVLKGLILAQVPPRDILEKLETYYASFKPEKRVSVREDDCPILGNPKAPISVVEFSDYRCPHCAAVVAPLHALVESSAGKVRLCAKYFEFQPRSDVAAGCAEYARQHGKFWQMNDTLFAHQTELDDAQLRERARECGLDGDAMLQQVFAHAFDEVIQRQKQEAIAAHVAGTPTLFLSGRRHTLPFDLPFLQQSADDELEWQRNHGAWDKL